jgi:hypothetical protein
MNSRPFFIINEQLNDFIIILNSLNLVFIGFFSLKKHIWNVEHCNKDIFQFEDDLNTENEH